MTKYLRPYNFFSTVLLLLLFSFNTAFGQAIGDYQSAPSTATTPGAWTSLSSWVRWDGTQWIQPTVAQGYPGGTDNGINEAVTILAGHTIRIGDGSGADFSSQPMGKITIIGKLYLAGNGNNPIPRFELDAQWVYVEPNVGIIEFNNKVNLWLISSLYPGTGIFTVNKDLTTGYKSIIGDCSNNQDINFGPDATSYCAGKKFTFDDLMTSGGSLNAAIGSIPAVCQGSTVTLTGSYTGLIGTPAVYGWHIVDSSGITQDFTGANVSFPNATGTSYTIKLTVSTVYNVTPFTNSETVTVAVNTPPVAPVATAGTALSCTSVRANWQAVSGATSYVLDVATNSGFTSMVTNYNAVNVGDVLSKDITGLTSGTTYYYRVRAFNGTCNSPNSNVITVVAPSVPAAPAGLATGEILCNHIDLNWNAVSGATSYTVESATDSGFTANHVTVTGLTSTAYTFGGLSMGIEYYFRVTAVNACASTSSSIGPIRTRNMPVVPTNVGSNTVLCAQFNVTWTDVDGAADYTVEVATNSNFTAGLKSFPGVSAPSFTVTGLSPLTPYYYRVIAVNGCGSGTPVDGPDPVTTIASIPDIPAAVAASIVECNKVRINWEAAARAVDYTVEIATNSGFSPVLETVPNVKATTYTFTGLVGTSYYYRVLARNGCGSSGYAPLSPVFVTTGIIPPTPTITADGLTAICQGNLVKLTSSASSGNVWSTTATTQSIDVTTAGSYTVQVVNPEGCVSPVSAQTTVTVQARPTAVAGGIETICSNTSATISIASASNGTILWTASGGTGILKNGTTITPIYTPPLGGPAETVILTMTVTGVNGCASVVATASHTVNVLVAPAAPTVSSTQPTCVVTTGTITVNSPLPSTGILYTVTDINSVSPDITNATGVFTGLATGDYLVTYQINSGCISLASSQTLTSPVTNTWDGTKWSKTGDTTPPSSLDVVVFNAPFNITTPINACSCQINSGVTVVFGVPVSDPSYLPNKNADAILKIENGLAVLGNGTLTFENNASLIQVNEAVNTGKIIYKRITTPMKNFDFTYWCSPVKDQKLYDLSPNTLWDKYYSFNNGAWKVEAYGNALMELAKGYIIRVPKPQFWPDPNALTYEQPVQFVGVPNNGSIAIAAQGLDKDNLIGNPYPSPIDARLFMTTNSEVIKDGSALQFWTHKTAVAPSGSFYVYDAGDYASYNLSGGIAATTGGDPPSGEIAAGQSFFVMSKNGNDFVFNNSMRNTPIVLDSDSNSHFFRMSQTKKMVAIEENRVWLNLTNTGGAFKQLLVGYVTGATNGMDNLYDGISIDANTYVDFYSINSGKNLAIQGRALPFADTDEVPLGYRTTIQGNFTISIAKTDGVLVNQDIFIEDKVTGTVTNIKNGTYTFSTAVGVFNSRFVLRFMDNTSISQSGNKVTSDTADKSVFVLTKNKQVKIKSYDEIIDKVRFYDLKTSLLYEKENVNSKEFNVTNFNSREQFLIVQILLKNGKWVTKQIIF